MIETKHNIIRDEKCCICGKKFRLIVRKSDNKIISDCFHMRLNKYYMTQWMFQIAKDKKKKIVLVPVFKNKLWKILGYTKFQRTIIRTVWNWFYGYQKFDLYECPKCTNRKDD